ncbi:galactofuranose ABC transporter, permease protein YjfF [Endobacterium cereale]|uniref:galactofuranose ABC transporter, permease protein YjfF n=1 Tax=Endobacterium cereale TaxID=2663029 RepID=UPI002B46ECC9|nr:galactofuranose ABC transporter, permease protein YjfF [Endobacterium cereale]MEB2844502.1 galactofuranose ABC transporter, permease protein YjfF [Endobacterium cereale]
MSQRYLPLLATLAIFIIAYIASTFQFPPMFSTRVIGNLLTDNAFLGIAAVGMTFVILSGGIDLSIGSVIAFTSIFLAMILATTSIHPLLAFAIVLVMTTAFGALMGAIIHYLDMPAFIVTLGGMFLARGLAFVVSIDSIPIKHPFYETLQDWYLRLPGGGRFTLIGAAMIVTFLVCIVIAHRTRFGANVYALGGGVATAKLMGVDVARTTIAIYAVSGLLAGLSGIVYSIYTSAGYSLATVGVELDAIAAVVIGGTLLSGGVGFVAGTFIGIAIQGLIQTYITFDGTLSSWWTKILIGIVLFSFVAMQKGILLFSKDRSQKAG